MSTQAASSGWRSGSSWEAGGSCATGAALLQYRPPFCQVTWLDLPSKIYIIEVMIEIDLEPEVEAWLLALQYGHYQRVMRNVDDYLVTGGIPDGDHVKKLQAAEGIYELRVALDRTTWRITFWKPGGQLIILLTFFRKTRDGTQRADVDRAVRAMNTCRTEHDRTITHDFERSE
jgi:phage-related protein